MAQEKLTADVTYDVHKNKNIDITVVTKNAMDSSIDIFFDATRIRSVASTTGTHAFPNLKPGSKAEGHTLTVVAITTDVNPNSDRFAVDVVIEGGAAPNKTELFKRPVKDGDTEFFVVKYTLV